MATEILPIPDSPEDHEPDVVRTPEGDNEIPPDQPLRPTPPGVANGLETPRGSAPDPYKGE
jgi:hypothetical protein